MTRRASAPVSAARAAQSDAYVAQILMKDQERQEKQTATEVRRLGVEVREVSAAAAAARAHCC